MNFISLKNYNFKKISTILLKIFCLFNVANLILLVINSFGKTIIYEDSFMLFNPFEDNFWTWLLKSHNGHLITLSKSITVLFNNLSISPTGYNITISILIIFLGINTLKKIFDIISINNDEFKDIYFLICVYLWTSSAQWENLIWEFQIPWFLIAYLVLNLTHRYLILEEEKSSLIANVYFLLSPIVACLSSGQGIFYTNCLIPSLLFKGKIKYYSAFGISISYAIFIIDKIIYQTGNLSLNLNLIENIYYILVMIFTIFKPSIPDFNQIAKVEWIIPILSSTVLQLFLIKENFLKILLIIKNKINKLYILTPILFSLQFILITSLTRSRYGIHQGAVSRYLTCTNFLIIGLIILFFYLNQLNDFDNISKKIKIKDKDIKIFSNIFILCLLLNTSFIFKTIFATQNLYLTRLDNFQIFITACKDYNQFKENDISIKKYYDKFNPKIGANIPPLPDSKNFLNFKNYLDSPYCKSLKNIAN